MKDNDITDMLDLTFTVNEEVFGQVCVCPPQEVGGTLIGEDGLVIMDEAE